MSETQFIDYCQLTWSDVAKLPRTIPMVIPFGYKYNYDKLVYQLGYPTQICCLPPIPFGWRGSSLAVEENVFSNFVTNILNNLHEDGFTNIYLLALSPQVLGTYVNIVILPNIPDIDAFPKDSESEKVIIIPIGHTEQHGYHLPLSTDTVIIEAITQGIINKAPMQATRVPVMPYGVSTHRTSFPGTLSINGRVFEDFWLNVIDQLVGRGFNRFYLLSGHGGNCSFLVNVVKYAGEKHRRIFCATSWLYLSGPAGVSALEKYRRSKIGGMGHACELETSLILYLNPELVNIELVTDEIDFIATPSYYMDWVEGGALIANPPWDDDTKTGAYGAGSLATSEHGKLWLEAAIDEKVTHISEIQEQYSRREARRESGFGLWGRNT